MPCHFVTSPISTPPCIHSPIFILLFSKQNFETVLQNNQYRWDQANAKNINNKHLSKHWRNSVNSYNRITKQCDVILRLNISTSLYTLTYHASFVLRRKMQRERENEREMYTQRQKCETHPHPGRGEARATERERERERDSDVLPVRHTTLPCGDSNRRYQHINYHCAQNSTY